MLDGELREMDLQNLLDEYAESPLLQQRWQRLCATRAAMQNVPLRREVDLCSGVMAAIAAAPTRAEIIDFAQARARKPAPASVWRHPAIGVAAAASVAALAIVGGLRMHQSVVPESPAVAALAPSATVAATALPATPVSVSSRRLDPYAARQLDSYVMEYSNYRTAQGMDGALGYARFAARTAEYSPAGGPR